MTDPNPRDLDPVEREILARRTSALARTAAPSEALRGVEVLVVRAAGRRVAVPIEDVVVAAPLRQLTAIPFAPPALAGVTLIDGVVAPVFHLHALLGLGTVTLPEHGRVLLVGPRELPLPLAVEAAETIDRLDPDALSPIPDPTGPAARRTRGIAADGTLLLDVAALLEDPEILLDVEPVEHEPPEPRRLG